MSAQDQFSNADSIVELIDVRPDPTRIGLHTSLMDKLESMEQQFNCKLQITNGMRWKNGTYDLIKQTAERLVFFKFDKRPRSGFKWTEYSTWRLDQYRGKLSSIEDEMVRARQNGETMHLNSEDALVKFQTFLDTLYSTNIHTYITNPLKVGLRLEGSKYRGRQYRNINEPRTDVEPFIQLTFKLKDVELTWYKDVQNSNDTNIIAKQPWGNLLITFELPLYWWVNTHDRNSSFRRIDQLITRHSTIQPIYKGTQHPFVHKDRAYQNGNICFGDVLTTILKNVHKMRWPVVMDLLYNWARTYVIGRTGPLNQPPTTHVGLNASWMQAGFEGYCKDLLAPDPSVCKKVYREDYIADAKKPLDARKLFISDHCNNCVVQDNCDAYELFFSDTRFNVESEFRQLLIDEGVPTQTIDWREIGDGDDCDLFCFGLNISELSRQFATVYRNTVDDDTQERYSQGIARNINRILALKDLYDARGGWHNGQEMNYDDFGQAYNEVSVEALIETTDLINSAQSRRPNEG